MMFDPSYAGLHVPNCELFAGKFDYKKTSLAGLIAQGKDPDYQKYPQQGWALLHLFAHAT